MKRLFIGLMAMLLLLQSSSGLVIMSAFYANRSYIAKNLCENRFNLNSACHGQCVLMKKLKKEMEREQKQPDLKFKEVQFLIPKIDLPAKAIVCQTPPPVHPVFDQPLFSSEYITGIFHPPLYI